jgi:hypothetical protein
MSGRTLGRLAMLLGVLLLLWGGAALTRRHGDAPPGTVGRFHLPSPAATAVDTVRITRPGDTVMLARRDSSWTVNGHTASRTAVAELFTALGDTASRPELVAERPPSHAGLGVDSAKGTRVRLVRGDSVIGDFIAGQRSADMDGGYLRLAGQSEVYLVRGALAGLLERGPEEWRDHRIAAVPVDSVAAIQVQRGTRGYKLAKDAKGWTLSPGGPADTAAAAQLRQAFGEIDAAGFASPAQADSARFDRPDRRVTALRSDGTPLLRLVFDSTTNGFWVRAGSGGTVYRMDGWAVDRLAPADSTLRPARR